MQTLQSGDLRKFHVIKGPHARKQITSEGTSKRVRSNSIHS